MTLTTVDVRLIADFLERAEAARQEWTSACDMYRGLSVEDQRALVVESGSAMAKLREAYAERCMELHSQLQVLIEVGPF